MNVYLWQMAKGNISYRIDSVSTQLLFLKPVILFIDDKIQNPAKTFGNKNNKNFLISLTSSIKRMNI